MIDGGERVELSDLSSSTRACNLDSERPATAHLMLVGSLEVMCSAVNLPVYPVAPKRTMSNSRFAGAIGAVETTHWLAIIDCRNR